MFNYDKFKQAYYILENDSLSNDEKQDKLFKLKKEIMPEDYVSPA
jgi:hypothetical protein